MNINLELLHLCDVDEHVEMDNQNFSIEDANKNVQLWSAVASKNNHETNKLTKNMQESSDANRLLTSEELEKLESQNSRMVSEFQAMKLETEAKRNWDLFYKRNETRFFRDRHWTTREFTELLDGYHNGEVSKVMLEIGCGVGNFVYPLMEDGFNMFIYACDLSPRAIEFVKSHPLYCETKIKAFQADITIPIPEIPPNSVDVVTMIFVLSAIHPDKFRQTLENIFKLVRPGGIVLMRDYGLYDMAQLRFKPGHKIADNFYMRQDGTRAYYFSLEFLAKIFSDAGFDIISNTYILRKTVNKKEKLDAQRIFVQGKFRKPCT